MNHYLVRLGLFGQVARCAAASGEAFRRGQRVVCRTARGLEVGTLLQGPARAAAVSLTGNTGNTGSTGNEGDTGKTESAGNTGVLADAPPGEAAVAGRLLRRVTPEDDLILARLERDREQAFLACVQLLAEREIPADLVEVEHLFDGRSIYFYFLGEVTPEIDEVTRELAEVYETKVQFRQFADLLERGCGPGCGTESAAGCGTAGGCGACSIASSCASQAPLDA